MYAFRVSPHVENLINECAARLITSGVPVSQSVFFFSNAAEVHDSDTAKKGDAKGASGFEYSIAINKYIVNDKDISDTVAHELLHTIKTAKNHDANWKYWANFVSRNTPFTITVRANIKLQPAAYKKIIPEKGFFPVEQYDEKHDDYFGMSAVPRQNRSQKNRETRQVRSERIPLQKVP
ncbi:MAG: hypothetical protein L6V79_04705 [Clostridium sp.]|nr:MAG: hypothetical protein L6V79_04705 [Clostridium sp.]